MGAVWEGWEVEDVWLVGTGAGCFIGACRDRQSQRAGTNHRSIGTRVEKRGENGENGKEWESGGESVGERVGDSGREWMDREGARCRSNAQRNT
jgi:hypothetical protein